MQSAISYFRITSLGRQRRQALPQAKVANVPRFQQAAIPDHHAQTAGKILDAMVPNIQRTAELVQEIAAASIEQDAGAEQISKAIQQLDAVIQANASSSEEMASTSEELSSQAEQMQSAIGFFRLGQGASRSVRTLARKTSDGRAQALGGTQKALPEKRLVSAYDNLDADFERF